MIRRPPRSTQSRSSAASDVYKRQLDTLSALLEPSTGVLAKTGRTVEHETINESAWRITLDGGSTTHKWLRDLAPKNLFIRRPLGRATSSFLSAVTVERAPRSW